MTPRDVLALPLQERMQWAALAALVGTIHDGPERGTDVRKLARLEAACRWFGVPAKEFDQCAQLLDYHYYRPWDCYLSKATLDEVASRSRPPDIGGVGRGTIH